MLSERYGEAAAEAKNKGKALREKEALLDAVMAQVSQEISCMPRGVFIHGVLGTPLQEVDLVFGLRIRSCFSSLFWPPNLSCCSHVFLFPS